MTSLEMYRKRTSGIYILLFGLLWLLYPIHTFAIVSIGDMLYQLTSQAEQDQTLKDLPGKASVNSLYKKAYTMSQQKSVQTSFDASNSIVAYFQSIANSPVCSRVSRNDVIAVLYNTNHFFRQVVTDIADTVWQDFVVPTKVDRANACATILACVQKTSLDESKKKFAFDTINLCEDLVTTAYQSAWTTSIMARSYTDNIYGSDYFQNGTLDDSDYDLLLDIYNIGTIMFEWFQKPVEILFFRLPTVSWLLGWSNNPLVNNVPGLLDILWQDGFIPSYISGSMFSWSTWSILTGIVFTGIVTGSPSTSPSWSSWISFGTSTVDTFIDSVNTAWSDISPINTNPSISFGTVQCVDPLTTLPLTPTNPLVDPVLSSDTYNELVDIYYDTLNPEDLLDDVLAIGSDDSVNNSGINGIWGSSSSIPSLTIEEKEALVDNFIQQAFDLEDTPEDSGILSCLSSCDGLPIADKLVCQSECLCWEIQSPAITNEIMEAAGVAIPAGAFKIRICRIAATNASVQRNRRILSIEEIFDEINNIFTSLRQSGQLFKHVKTKEFLDSSVKQNKFGDIFAFTIRVGTKWVRDMTPASLFQKKLSEQDAWLKQSILWAGWDPLIPTERNKYTVIVDQATQKARAQSYFNPSQFDELIQREKYLLEQSTQVFDLTGYQKQISVLTTSPLISDQVVSFLQDNLQFWMEAYDTLSDINGIANSLKTKIEKAK